MASRPAEATAVMPVSGSMRTSTRSSANSIPASGLKNPAVSVWRSNWMASVMTRLLSSSRTPLPGLQAA